MAGGRGGRIGCLFNEKINKANLALQRPTVVRYRTPSLPPNFRPPPTPPPPNRFSANFAFAFPRDAVNPTDTNLGAFLAVLPALEILRACDAVDGKGENEELARLAKVADGAVN